MRGHKWIGLFISVMMCVSGEAWACQVTATGMSFGQYDAIGSQPAAGTGFLRLTCPRPATIRLNAGLNSQGAFTNRFLAGTNPTHRLRYNLFLDPTALRPWGDGSANTFIQQVPAGVSSLTIYGLVHGGQRMPPGVYADTITVTIEW